MKIFKYFTILTLMLCLCQVTRGEERRKPISLEELTDPSSRFYLPHPYPKTKEEITADLIYGVKDHIAKIKAGTQSSTGERLELRKIIDIFLSNIKNIFTSRKAKKTQMDYLSLLLDMVEGKSDDFKIGEISKVKNRMAWIPHDYLWLIIITDKNKKIIYRINMDATGRVDGFVSIKSGYFTKFLVSKKDILYILAAAIKKPISDIKVKKIEQVAFKSRIAPPYAPMWKIVLENGPVYYYSIITDNVYVIDMKIPREKDKNGNWKSEKELVPHEHFVVDTISDEILVFKFL